MASTLSRPPRPTAVERCGCERWRGVLGAGASTIGPPEAVRDFEHAHTCHVHSLGLWLVLGCGGAGLRAREVGVGSRMSFLIWSTPKSHLNNGSSYVADRSALSSGSVSWREVLPSMHTGSPNTNSWDFPDRTDLKVSNVWHVLGTRFLSPFVVHSGDAFFASALCLLLGTLRRLVACFSAVVALVWEVLRVVLVPLLPGLALSPAPFEGPFALSLALPVAFPLGVSGDVRFFQFAPYAAFAPRSR